MLPVMHSGCAPEKHRGEEREETGERKETKIRSTARKPENALPSRISRDIFNISYWLTGRVYCNAVSAKRCFSKITQKIGRKSIQSLLPPDLSTFLQSADNRDQSGPVHHQASVRIRRFCIFPMKKMIKIQTNHGDISLELDSDKAPETVKNFLSWLEKGHYDQTIFHRVIPGFMIQGGGFTADMTEKHTGAAIQNEANNGLKNVRGTIAMARTSDPHSAGTQFFINLVDNSFLDFSAPTQQGWGYCVFGRTTDAESLKVIDSIAAVKTGSHGHHSDVPLQPVLIEKACVAK